PGGAQTSVQPPNAIIPRGSSITVNCSTSCDQHTLLGLETQLAKREVDHGNNWKIFELSGVQKDSMPICYSSCPSGQASALMNLTVYFLPMTDPHLATHRVLEVGTEWQVNCTLAWVKGKVEEEGVQYLTCAVNLGGQSRRSQESVTIYNGPRLNERDCLGNWTWQEGSQQTLRCQAWGNPTPKLNCSRKEDGALLPIGDLRPVKREVAGTYQCRATSTCGEVTREVVINVIYHQNNMAIVIPGLELRCALLRHLRGRNAGGHRQDYRLQRGGRVIYSESLERFTGRDLANVTLTYTLRARPSDFGQPVTCHARLNLDGLVVLSSSAPVTLPVLAWSPASKALASTSIAALVGILLVLVDIREPETQPVCFFRCARRTLQARGLIRTFREFSEAKLLSLPSRPRPLERPDRVELVPLPAWQPVGENFTLSCRVPGAGPRGSLTLTLLRGAQELIRRSFSGEPPRARGAVLTATVLARREDHGANFSCRAELDLRPHGLGLFENSSAPRELRTFALPPEPPRLAAPRLLEVGSEGPVSCAMDGLFPASEAEVYLALGDQRLSPDVTLEGDALMATATATASAEQEGARQLVCNVTLGGESRETQENPNASEGKMVTVTCAAGARSLVTLDGIPAAVPGQPAQLQLNATENDDRRVFFCDATLEVDGETLSKNESAELRVLCELAFNLSPTSACLVSGRVMEVEDFPTPLVSHAPARRRPPAGRFGLSQELDMARGTRADAALRGPRKPRALGSRDIRPVPKPQNSTTLPSLDAPALDSVGCPERITWLEGTEASLSCVAHGVPPPSVNCVRSGEARVVEGLLRVVREHAGTYRCEATNARGFEEVSCPSNWTWVEGSGRLFSCEVDGKPEPSVECVGSGGTSEGVLLPLAPPDPDVAGRRRGCCAGLLRPGSPLPTSALLPGGRAPATAAAHRPVVAELAASPPGGVRPGGNFTLTCRAEAWPPAQISWRAPPGALNIGLSSNNSTLSVAGAMGSHGGEYECAATNAHGRHTRRITVRVAAALLAAGAGLAFYVQSTACKKGEYNVQEAESS
ncbi:hypothetical protein E2I00_009486, partial [Balaenoptera physalus]